MEKEKELCMTPVDLAAGGEELQLLKALVPYLACGVQKPVVLLIKCMEIRNLTAFFNKPAELSAQTAESSQKAHGLSDILPEISPYLPWQQREQFSQILPLLEMMQLSSMNQEGEGSAPMDLFSSLLSPEQQAMFSMFSQSETEKGGPKPDGQKLDP